MTPSRKIVFFAFATLFNLINLSAELAYSKTLQKAKEVEIDDSNVDELVDLLEAASNGTTFAITSDIKLTTTIEVKLESATFRGRKGNPPIIRCAPDSIGFKIRANGVRFENLVIRDCRSTAVFIETSEVPVEGLPDPFTEDYEEGDLENSRANKEKIGAFFENVDFLGNKGIDVGNAGAIYAIGFANLTLQSCRFVNNSGVTGGAVEFGGMSLSVSDCEFTENTGELSGGAIFAVSAYDIDSEFLISNTNFTGNKALKGRVDAIGASENDFLPQDQVDFIKFRLPSPSGGALFLSNFSEVQISQCNFIDNNAVTAGGAIYMYDSGKVLMERTIFRRNQVVGDSGILTEVQLGGAIFATFDQEASSLLIESSIFANNSAAYGGALHIVGPSAARVEVRFSSFLENVGTSGGGALVLRRILYTVFQSVSMERNRAFVGGAVLVADGGGIQILRPVVNKNSTTFQNNVAYDGGAIYGLGGGFLQINSCLFSENFAQRNGGAICYIDAKAGVEMTFRDIQLSKNKAEKGGGIYAENLQSILFFSSPPNKIRGQPRGRALQGSSFSENEAVAGAALYYRASHLVTNSLLVTDTMFSNNRARANLTSVFDGPDFGEPSNDMTEVPSLAETPDRKLDLRSVDPCYPGGGGALCLVLNRISSKALTSVQILNTNFTQNSAVAAGAVLVSTSRKTRWRPNCEEEETAVRRLTTSEACRRFKMTNVIFESNAATDAGGAILAAHFDHLFYSESEDSHIYTIDQMTSNRRFSNNSVSRKGYGPILAGTAKKLRVFSVEQDEMDDSVAFNGRRSRESTRLKPIKVEIVDGLDQIIKGGIVDSVLPVRVVVRDPVDSKIISDGQTLVAAENGQAVFAALQLNTDPGNYSVKVLVDGDISLSNTITAELSNCTMGEYYYQPSFVCVRCDFETFTLFDQSSRCQDCPYNARCSGGHSLVPLEGYWHSSPFSVLMHECFDRDACRYHNREGILEETRSKSVEEFFRRFQNLSHPTFTNREYPQCSEGYEGPLCGSCSPGYGQGDGKVCIKCENQRATAVTFCLLAAWQLILLGITIRGALVSMKNMYQVMALCGQTTTRTIGSDASVIRTTMHSSRSARFAVLGVDDVPRPEISIDQPLDRVEEASITVSNPATIEDEANTLELVVVSQNISEALKIFVNFFQVTSIALSINVEWTKTIRNMLKSMNSAAGFSSGSALAPVTCLMDTDTSMKSIYGVIFRVVFPWCLMLVPMSIFCIQWMFTEKKPRITHRPGHHFIVSRTIICCLVVAFFSYQSISEDLMSTVSCIDLDSKEIDNISKWDSRNSLNYSQFSVARNRYWAMDTSIECYKDRHAYLVGFLGVPGLLFFVCGLPLYLLGYLLYQRHYNNLKDIEVFRTYGFIYQNYRSKFVYWEVIILVRKALVGAVVVFAYPLGSNLQGVMALGLLIISLIIHLLAGPFKYRPLNILEGCSLVVSLMAFYSGIVFNDESTSNKGRIFLTVLLMSLCGALVAGFVFTVCWLVDKYIAVQLNIMKEINIPSNPVMRWLLLIRLISNKLWRDVWDRVINIRSKRDKSGRAISDNVHDVRVTTSGLEMAE